uniref:Uncharacterized protein n=1 Tax=Candidatus Kentrum sp. FM TaxID=2126340 RepID=A0A450SDC3_9GAMM|nr:MAG: hypothetical protein BECKFM1743A_GA0114220_100854 [Candidatus Kentron sp. FM]
MSLRKKLLDTFGAQVSSDHERYPADVKCLGLLYLYVGRYPRNNASRNNTACGRITKNTNVNSARLFHPTWGDSFTRNRS